jgi:hypothetical protein
MKSASPDGPSCLSSPSIGAGSGAGGVGDGGSGFDGGGVNVLTVVVKFVVAVAS